MAAASFMRNELITLSDIDLRDIRWTRAEMEAEARKPFWRAWSTWSRSQDGVPINR